MVSIGEALKYQREAAKLTQRQLAKETGITQVNICRWERGEVLPGIDFCIKLAEYYGISLDELIGRDIKT